MRRPALLATLAAAVVVAAPVHAQAPKDPVSILDQTDGVTSKRATTIALYCRKDACAGRLKLKVGTTRIGSAPFSITPKTTAHVPVKLTKAGFALVKGAPRRKLKTTLVVTLASGQALTHVITLKA